MQIETRKAYSTGYTMSENANTLMSMSSTSLAPKLREIRKSEGLTQVKFGEMLGISPQSLRNLESGQRGVGTEILLKVTNHERFHKYTLWLLTGKVIPEGGQVKPLDPKAG